ncbi:hypothetical protein PENSPDRAFT_590307 [Peniophora sp. CONT]|nr:hypothetical protein PENSPDRAFT_590307 [Peniophora sp. CONT]
MKEVVELWARDALELVRNLIGNPAFAAHMHYAPVQVDTGQGDEEEDIEHVFGDMHTSRKWWTLQIKCDDGTVVPIILASDKTQLSTFSGDKQAWPVYLTIGNISSEIRMQPSKHAMVLLGYIPVTKLNRIFYEKDRKVEGHRLFHFAMKQLLAPLVEAGSKGVEMTCADGFVRRVFPILFAYLADFPEQCLITCTKNNRCTVCKVDRSERGRLLYSTYRDPAETLAHLAAGDDEDLNDIPSPFWADLPFANIFSCITPDILHQLHKGVFKDHLVYWTTLGREADIDDRFSRVPPYPGLRVFARGISKISQWTGNEYRQMEKVFLCLLCGVYDEDPRFISAARAVLDFIYLAHFPVQTTSTLALLQDALERFHASKDVFVDLEIRKDFNIPKIHSMLHYAPSIIECGSALPLSTDAPERLHIDFAKLAYRSTNRKHYVRQMILWLTRREKLAWLDSFYGWLALLNNTPTTTSTSPSPVDDVVYDDEIVYDSPENDDTDDIYGPSEPQAAAAGGSDAKRPTFGRRTPNELATHFGATNFIPALREFLAAEISTLNPQYLAVLSSHRFGVYAQFRRTLPALRGLPARYVHEDTVFATPRTSQLHDRFSTVLFVENRDVLQPLGLQGYRAAQVRAIFDLPDFLQSKRSASSCRHLAYIELFTQFMPPERYSRLYRISRRFENMQRKAIIIPLDIIFRSCHLVPDFGSTVNRAWASDTVLELAPDFFLNPFCDHHMYLFV